MQWKELDLSTDVARVGGAGFHTDLSATSSGFVLTGYTFDEDTTRVPTVWRSTDGHVWDRRQIVDAGPDTRIWGTFAGDDGLFLIDRGADRPGDPPDVYLLGADGTGTVETTEGLPPSFANGPTVGHSTNGWFAIDDNESEVVYRSSDGVSWDEVDLPGLDRMDGPVVQALVSGDGGVFLFIGDEANTVHPYRLTDEEAASLPAFGTGAPMRFDGGIVGGDEILLVGGRRDGSSFAPHTWKSVDGGQTWTDTAATLHIAETHTSLSTSGGWFTDVVRRSDGTFVAAVFTAASHLFLASDDAVTWQEIPLASAAESTEVPGPWELAAFDGHVVAASVDFAIPAVLVVAPGLGAVTQVRADDLARPLDELTAGVPAGGQRLVLPVRREIAPVAITASSGVVSHVLTVGTDTTTVSSAANDVFLMAAAVFRDGPVVVGFDAWTGAGREDGIQARIASQDGSDFAVRFLDPGLNPDDAVRAFDALPAGDRLAIVGTSILPDGSSRPEFWNMGGPIDPEIQIPPDAPPEIVESAALLPRRLPVENAGDLAGFWSPFLCPTSGGDALGFGSTADPAGGYQPVMFRFSAREQGAAWIQVEGNGGLPADADLWTCAVTGDHTTVVGAIDIGGEVFEAAAWTTTDGSQFVRLDVDAPDGIDRWWDVLSVPDQDRTFLVGWRPRADDSPAGSVLVELGNEENPLELRGETLLGPGERGDISHLAVVGGELWAVVDRADGIHVFRATLPPLEDRAERETASEPDEN